MNLEEFLEGIVTAVKHVIRSCLVGNLAHHLGIVHRSLRDVEERRHGGLQIVKEMDLHAAFPFSELCPPEDRQTQRYCCRVERIDITVQLEDVHHPFAPGLGHHIEGEVFKNPIVPVLVDSCQRRLGDGLGAHAHVVALRLMSLQRNNQVAQAFAVAELAKYHDKQLVPAGEVFDIVVALVFADEVVELAPIQKRSELRENIL